MNNPEQNIELIEGYLLDKASFEDRQEVERLLSDDKEFAQLFQELKILIGGIQHSTRQEILSQLKDEESNIQKENSTLKGKVISINEPTKKRNLWAPLSIAASLILLIGLVIFNNPFSKKDQALASYYEPLSTELLYNYVRSESPETLPKEAIAAKALIDKDTDQAKIILNQMIFDDANDLDTMENIIRVYANLLLQENQRACKVNNAKFDQLKDATKSTKWYGTVLLDQILLQQKCKSIDLSVDLKVLDTLSLTDYDAEKWTDIKKHIKKI
ncbi:MAG: hypothetical protein R2728_09940 [Chitinophagales bacterium]